LEMYYSNSTRVSSAQWWPPTTSIERQTVGVLEWELGNRSPLSLSLLPHILYQPASQLVDRSSFLYLYYTLNVSCDAVSTYIEIYSRSNLNFNSVSCRIANAAQPQTHAIVVATYYLFREVFRRRYGRGNGNFSLTGSCLYYVHCAGCIYFLICLLCKSHRTPPIPKARLWFLFPPLVQKALASDICRDGQQQPFCLFSLSLYIVGYVKLDGKKKRMGSWTCLCQPIDSKSIWCASLIPFSYSVWVCVIGLCWKDIRQPPVHIQSNISLSF
jgi:hypothetical protein